MKSHFLMLPLVLLIACQSKPAETGNTETNPPTAEDMVPVMVPIKTEMYPNGTLFRELNTHTLEAKIYSADGKLYLKGKYMQTYYVNYCVMGVLVFEANSVDGASNVDMYI